MYSTLSVFVGQTNHQVLRFVKECNCTAYIIHQIVCCLILSKSPRCMMSMAYNLWKTSNNRWPDFHVQNQYDTTFVANWNSKTRKLVIKTYWLSNTDRSFFFAFKICWLLHNLTNISSQIAVWKVNKNENYDKLVFITQRNGIK